MERLGNFHQNHPTNRLHLVSVSIFHSGKQKFFDMEGRWKIELVSCVNLHV